MKVKQLNEVEKFYITSKSGLGVEQLLKDLGRKPTPQNIKLVKDLVDILPAVATKQPEPGIPGHFLKQSGSVAMTMAQSSQDDKSAEAQRTFSLPGVPDAGIHKIRPNEPSF